jgi:hypothetical protein
MMPDDGAGPTIVAVHPVAPLPSELQSWKSTSGGSPVPALKRNVILAGDFNATLDHLAGLALPLRTPLSANATDAALRARPAAVGTWPICSRAPRCGDRSCDDDEELDGRRYGMCKTSMAPEATIDRSSSSCARLLGPNSIRL